MRAPLVYTAVWIALCALAIVLVAREPREYALVSRRYFVWLAAPWRLGTFAVAAGFFVVAAPYTGDPTWDHVDGAFMSALAFVTAPWSVAAVYRVARGKLARRQLYVAACVWLFSASFSYDAYVYLRDGRYPATWWSNAIASSVLYAAAGLFWNLSYRAGRGVIFELMAEDWLAPVARAKGSRRIAAYGAVFVLLVVAMMVPFFWGDLLPLLRR